VLKTFSDEIVLARARVNQVVAMILVILVVLFIHVLLATE